MGRMGPLEAAALAGRVFFLSEAQGAQEVQQDQARKAELAELAALVDWRCWCKSQSASTTAARCLAAMVERVELVAQVGNLAHDLVAVAVAEPEMT